MVVNTDTTKSFWEHLSDLKPLVLKIVMVWVVITCFTFFFSSQLFALVTSPLNGQVLKSLSPTEPLTILLKIHFFAGFILSIPFILVILWNYLSVIFSAKEKRFIIAYTFSTLVLVLIGSVYAYFSLIPASLKILMSFAPKGLEVDITATEYLNFFLSLLLILILVFQTPIATFGIIYSGILTSTAYYKVRKEVYFSIVVIMAILTPTPDIFTLILIVLPILVLLEIAVFLAGSKYKKPDLP